MSKTLNFWELPLTVGFVELLLDKKGLVPDSRIFGKNPQEFYTKYYFKNKQTGKDCCFIHYTNSHLASFTFQTDKQDSIRIEHTSTRKRFRVLLTQLSKLIHE